MPVTPACFVVRSGRGDFDALAGVIARESQPPRLRRGASCRKQGADPLASASKNACWRFPSPSRIAMPRSSEEASDDDGVASAPATTERAIDPATGRPPRRQLTIECVGLCCEDLPRVTSIAVVADATRLDSAC